MKNFLAGIGIVLLVAICLIFSFAIITSICASVNQISFYDQLRWWFGSASNFAKLFIK